jgi:hypothetical protein
MLGMAAAHCEKTIDGDRPRMLFAGLLGYRSSDGQREVTSAPIPSRSTPTRQDARRDTEIISLQRFEISAER